MSALAESVLLCLEIARIKRPDGRERGVDPYYLWKVNGERFLTGEDMQNSLHGANGSE